MRPPPPPPVKSLVNNQEGARSDKRSSLLVLWCLSKPNSLQYRLLVPTLVLETCPQVHCVCPRCKCDERRSGIWEFGCEVKRRGTKYRGADKSLARPARKQATATEDFDVHISCL